MLTSLGLGTINRTLRSTEWALQRLRAHAGKVARVECLPFTATVRVDPNGELESPREAATPDVVVRMTPGAALRLLARDEAAWNEIGIEGDSHFATALNQVWQQLDWGFEEDLSHLVGDIAAHRIVTTATQARETAMHAVQSGLRNLLEYWTEERPVVALRHHVETYTRQVDALRDDVARLEKRIEALQAAARARFSAEYGDNNTTPPTSAGA